PDEDRWVATNALRLARVRGVPVVVLASYGAVDGGQHVLIQVLAADAAVARTVLTDLDAAVTTDSFLRGRVLTMTTATSASGPRTAVDIDERPGVVADDVVLPTDVLERLEAVVVDPTRDAARVLGCGQPLPRGVLLHGPSGAGMSDAVRYLVSQSPDTTAFLLPGTSLASLPPADSAALVREVMTAAQQLAPTLVVLEDADLVAEDRRGPGDDAATGPASPHGPAVRPALAELLDLLVETDEDADVAVVLTTHRIEALAETLARQPDRLDLVLEVPLPDVVARERLFARAARALPVTSAGIRTAAEAAVATPYAFPARVVRRAVLDAVAADGEVDDARLVATVRALLDERAQLRTAMGAGPVSRQHEAAPETAGSVAEVRGAGDVLAVIRAREAQRDAFGAEGALGGTGLHADGLVHADGLGGESGHDGDDDLGGGGGVDEWIGSSDDVDGDVDDGLSGEDLLDLDLDDED
ncbi:MAG TPA: ATP-binding protein, partial [Brevibacterium sp.]|nr:ATP-binding protein [Brevibacterium sp.]